MRKRLSWDEEKVAQIMKQADPYTMNQDRHNPPIEKYETGDPSAWAEDQNKNTPWKQEGRTETGHPAPAREAVVQAKKLEDKALKCITIAQRMLPGAADGLIEDQATDLMFLPEKSIMATLQRQSDLATKIAGEMKDDEDEKDAAKKDMDDEDEKDAAKKDMDEDEKDAAKKDMDEEDEKDAAKKDMDEDEKDAAKKDMDDEDEKDAVKKDMDDEDEKDAAKMKDEDEEKDAKKKAPKEEEVSSKKKKMPEEKEVSSKKEDEDEEVDAKKKKMPEEKEVSADKDLLDILFDNAEVAAATEAAAPKTGAKKLSGLVKQASTGDPLDNLWDTPPDVSSVFK